MMSADQKVYKDKDWLREQYCEQGLTLKECAELAGCHWFTIYNWMKRHGIPRRTDSETTKAAWARGCFDSEETWRKMSESAKASRAQGTHSSEETRRKMSDAAKAAWARGDFDERIFTEEARQKMSDAAKVRWARGDYAELFTKEVQQKKSDASKAAWARGVYDGVFQSPTSIEIAISDALDELGIMHVSQYRPERCRFTYDEYLLAQGILLEVNGDYWHSLSVVSERDVRKAEWAREHGFTPVTIWEYEIKERGGLAMIQDRILVFK